MTNKKALFSALSKGAACELALETRNTSDFYLLEKGLEQIEEGISIFDRQLKLVACNARFIELLDFPIELAQRCTLLESFYRYNAERGEYGPGETEQQVKFRMDRAALFEHHSYRRTRPDGTVLEINGTPITQYGFVTTYSDVTEQVKTAAELSYSYQRFQDMARAASDWFWELDADMHFSYVSERFAKAVDVPHGYIMGKKRNEIASPDDLTDHPDKWQQYYDTLNRHQPFRDFQYCFIGGGGRTYHLKVSGVPVFNAEGEFAGYRGTGTDATPLTQAQRDLATSEAQQRSILDSSASGAVITRQSDGKIVFANQTLSEMFRTATSTMEDRQATKFYKDKKHWISIIQRFQQGQSIVNEEVEYLRPDDSCFWALVTLRKICYHGEEATLTWIHDFTELHTAQEELKRLALTDSLTGLANRRMFQDQLERTIARANRSDAGAALLYFDIDQFKPINDQQGHDTGDWLLVALSQRVKQVLRRNDIFSRLGGDEFTILLDHIEGPEEARQVAEKISDCFNTAFSKEELQLQVDVSIGVCCFGGKSPGDISSPKELIGKADKAMYRAKQRCGNTICIAD